MSLKSMQGIAAALAMVGLVLFTWLWRASKPDSANLPTPVSNRPSPASAADLPQRVRQIQRQAAEVLPWLQCFYDSNGSVLAEMPDGGVPGAPEDALRQYLEYAYPRLKMLTEESGLQQAPWKKSLEQLLGLSGQTRLEELRQSIEKRRPYFQQTCHGAHAIQAPPAHHLTNKERRRIKLYAWVAFAKVTAALARLAQLQQSLNAHPDLGK